MKFFRKPEKTEAVVNAERVLMELSMRYSFIRSLTPSVLSWRLDEFNAGELRGFSMLAAEILSRDDKLPSLDPKRRGSVARLDWEIVTSEDTPEAKRQAEVLDNFYRHITATSAMDEDDVGGLKKLIRYMLQAVAFGWSVQEIVWSVKPSGVTATLRDVPLWYFEHRTARLRYLQSMNDYNGVDLQPGEWLVSRQPLPLMIPCSILYIYKHMPLRDWLIYSQRYVVPGLHGKTPAAKGTSEWNNLVAALKNFGLDWAVVTNDSAEIKPIDVSAKGELPYPKLVERCDRAMAILFRGADLSTMSSTAGQGTGASVQGEETDILVADDVELIEETFARRLSPYVLQYTLGTAAEEIKAKFQFQTPRTIDLTAQLAVDDKLISWNCGRSKRSLLEFYSRPLPADGEDLATPAAPALSSARSLMPNAAPLRRSLGEGGAPDTFLSQALSIRPEWLAPLKPWLDKLEALSNVQSQMSDAEFLSAVEAHIKTLPSLLPQCDTKALASILESAMAAALVKGAASSKAAGMGESGEGR